jgi:serine/threonine protein kinase
MFSLRYAPPELVLAMEAGQSSVRVRAALDVWALGIVAFELLTRSRAFPPGLPRERICAQLAGREPLPWEDPAQQEPLLRRLRGLRRSVLSCLDREPDARPSAAAVLGLWTSIFRASTGASVPVNSGKDPAVSRFAGCTEAPVTAETARSLTLTMTQASSTRSATASGSEMVTLGRGEADAAVSDGDASATPGQLTQFYSSRSMTSAAGGAASAAAGQPTREYGAQDGGGESEGATPRVAARRAAGGARREDDVDVAASTRSVAAEQQVTS